jgi:hypothetical protein
LPGAAVFAVHAILAILSLAVSFAVSFAASFASFVCLAA